jgi:hypothetical protein
VQQTEYAWAGIDAGKGHHHVVVIDGDGRRLLSRRVANDEPDLEAVIAAVLGCAVEVTWTIDLADGPAALVLALLLGRGQRVRYLPGVAVNRAADAYRGEGKTDAKDAAVIADQGRMRRDLRELELDDQVIAELRMLTAHRADLAADRTRAINRLRIQLLGVCPALERALDFTNRGPLVLISQFQSPQQLADAGQTEVEQWLRGHKVRHADRLAAAAVRAAATQHTRLVGEATAADLIARLARAVLDLDRQLADIDKRISTRFEVHRHHAIITSMVGIGTCSGRSSSLPLAVVSTGSPAQITWPATPDSRPHPGTRDARRQPAQAEALQPPTPARVLHLGADQHPAKPGVQGVLRPQESRRQTTQPGRTRPRPPARQRPLGHAPRPTHVSGTTTKHRRRGLTKRLRITCRRHEAAG